MKEIYDDDDDALRADVCEEWPGLTAMTIGQLDAAVRGITPAAAADTVLLWLDRTASLVPRAKALRADLEARAVDWIEANGDLVFGDMRYTAGHRSFTKCVDVPRGVEALLTVVGGEPAGLAAYLKSDPFRYGSCRSALSPAEYVRVFRTECRVVLRDGRPVRQLRRVDDRFRRFGRGSKHGPSDHA
jgi:hypothetical protein